MPRLHSHQCRVEQLSQPFVFHISQTTITSNSSASYFVVLPHPHHLAMVYRFTLPARQSPFTNTTKDGSPISRTISSADFSPHGLKRPRIYPQTMSRFPDKYDLDLQSSDKENLRASEELSDSQDTPGLFDPSNATTWGVKPLPLLHKGALLPLSQRRSSSSSQTEGDANLLQSPIIPSTPEPMPDSERFLQLMEQNLKIHGLDRPVTPASNGHRRHASSSYHSNEYESDRPQSPVSIVHLNKLSFSDLARFSKRNDRLSNLRSSSSSSPKLHTRDEDRDALEEASSAINGWQEQQTSAKDPFKHYELSESSDILPSDSLSQQLSPHSFHNRPLAILPRRSSIS